MKTRIYRNDHSTKSHGRVRKTWGQCKKALNRPPSQASLGGQPYSHAGRVKNTRALSKTSRDSVQRRQVAVRLGARRMVTNTADDQRSDKRHDSMHWI